MDDAQIYENSKTMQETGARTFDYSDNKSVFHVVGGKLVETAEQRNQLDELIQFGQEGLEKTTPLSPALEARMTQFGWAVYAKEDISVGQRLASGAW